MKVTVIGAAGSVGAPAAFYIGVTGLVDELVLIDMRPNVVQQHAMDMSTAMSERGVKVTASGDVVEALRSNGVSSRRRPAGVSMEYAVATTWLIRAGIIAIVTCEQSAPVSAACLPSAW